MGLSLGSLEFFWVLVDEGSWLQGGRDLKLRLAVGFFGFRFRGSYSALVPWGLK